MVAGRRRTHHGRMNESPPRPPRINIGGRHLVREPEDRMVGGVCSGVADALGVDVTLVRVLTVVLAIVTPWTLVAYLIALFVLPERQPDEPRVHSEAPGPLAHVPVPVLVAGVVVAALLLGDAWWLHPVPAALALVALGVWLVFRDRVPGSQHSNAEGVHGTTIPNGVGETPPSDATAGYEGAGRPDEPSPPGSTWLPGPPLEDATEPDWYTVPPATPATAVTPAPPPPAPALAPIVTAILLVGGGVLWLFDSLGAVDVPWRGAVAVALVLVGVTLVIATWWGRAAGLIPLAIALAAVLVV